MSTHANAAKLIRGELKRAFPNTKFSVRSNCYAGGSSINIEWENGPKRDSVDHLVKKYMYGDFNGMTDSYEYTNVIREIPQVNYVFLRREIKEETLDEFFKKLQKIHPEFRNVFSIDECSNDLYIKFRAWTARDYINKNITDLP